MNSNASISMSDTQPDVACHLNVLVPDVTHAGFPRALDIIAANGYRRAVLPPLDPAAADTAAITGALKASGLAPIFMAGQRPGANVSSPDAGERNAGLDSLRAMVDFVHSVGGDQLNGVLYGLFGPSKAPVDPEAFQRSAELVGQAADYAHDAGVMMTFEVLNRYETSMINTAARAMDYVHRSGSEHLRIHLDTFHMAIEESDMAEAIRTALPKLGYLELGQSGRGFLNKGCVDIVDVVRQAVADGYRGRWGIEAFSRSIISPEASSMLAIWRTTYGDGAALASDAMRLIRKGYEAA